MRDSSADASWDLQELLYDEGKNEDQLWGMQIQQNLPGTLLVGHPQDLQRTQGAENAQESIPKDN